MGNHFWTFGKHNQPLWVLNISSFKSDIYLFKWGKWKNKHNDSFWESTL